MTRAVGQLLLANLVVYVLTRTSPALFDAFSLVPAEVLTKPWTLFTYQFVHDRGSFMHIFFNMLALFIFGPKLEMRLGGRQFMTMYLAAGLVGAIVHIMWTVMSSSAQAPFVPMVGASAAVYGVLFGYARFWPRDRVMIWFVIPVQVRFLVIAFTIMSLWAGLGGSGGGVAHFAHLGGFLGGWIYLRARELLSPAKQFRKKAENPGVRMREGQLTARWQRIEPASLHPVNREEYDRISNKVRVSGWAALTKRERTFVDRFGGRFG